MSGGIFFCGLHCGWGDEFRGYSGLVPHVPANSTTENQGDATHDAASSRRSRHEDLKCILPTMATRDESVEQLTSIVWPLLGSLLASAWLMLFVCQFQLGSTLSWRALFIFPLACISLIACVHAAAIIVIQEIRDGQEDISTWPLIYGTWITVVWVPALAVLTKDGSAWVAVLLPLMTGLTTALLYRWSKRSEYECEGDLQSLFLVPAEPTLAQTIFPVLLTSIAAQFGLVALILRRDWLAALLLALASLLPVWRFPRNSRGTFGRGLKAPLTSSALALLLMMIALLPFLKNGPGHEALDRLLLELNRPKPAPAKARPSRPGAGYSGVILLLPPTPHQTVVPPAPGAEAPGKGKPRIIPFDGAYWYFKEPDDAPRPDARTVHGDPLKARIQSTNMLALQMEAHQSIVPALKMSCCSALRLNVINADTRPGAIAIEVVLRDTETKPHSATSLGTIILPSSAPDPIDPLRQPVHETLTFRFPRPPRAGLFSEITVRIKAAPERERANSQVSVESFVLVP
jgi:hypothetical protein